MLIAVVHGLRPLPSPGAHDAVFHGTSALVQPSCSSCCWSWRLQPLPSPAAAHDVVVHGDFSPCSGQLMLMMLSYLGTCCCRSWELQPLSSPADAYDAVFLGDLMRLGDFSPCPAPLMLMMLSFMGTSALASLADAHDAVVHGDFSACPAQLMLMTVRMGPQPLPKRADAHDAFVLGDLMLPFLGKLAAFQPS